MIKKEMDSSSTSYPHIAFVDGIWSSTTGNTALAKLESHSFAECHPRHSSLGLDFDNKNLFAKCFLSSTRQILSQVLNRLSATKSYRDGEEIDGGFTECRDGKTFSKVQFLDEYLGKSTLQTLNFAECLRKST